LRLRAPAALTPAKRLKFDSCRVHHPPFHVFLDGAPPHAGRRIGGRRGSWLDSAPRVRSGNRFLTGPPFDILTRQGRLGSTWKRESDLHPWRPRRSRWPAPR